MPLAAGARGADVALAADLEPDAGFGRGVEVGEGAVAGALAPGPDALDLVLLARGEELAAVAHGALEAQRAEIILTALEEHGLEFSRHELLHERNVLVIELLLQIDGVGGDERLAVFRERVEDGRGRGKRGFYRRRSRPPR